VFHFLVLFAGVAESALGRLLEVVCCAFFLVLRGEPEAVAWEQTFAIYQGAISRLAQKYALIFTLGTSDFIFYADRIIRLLVEEGEFR